MARGTSGAPATAAPAGDSSVNDPKQTRPSTRKETGTTESELRAQLARLKSTVQTAEETASTAVTKRASATKKRKVAQAALVASRREAKSLRSQLKRAKREAERNPAAGVAQLDPKTAKALAKLGQQAKIADSKCSVEVKALRVSFDGFKDVVTSQVEKASTALDKERERAVTLENQANTARLIARSQRHVETLALVGALNHNSQAVAPRAGSCEAFPLTMAQKAALAAAGFEIGDLEGTEKEDLVSLLPPKLAHPFQVHLELLRKKLSK